MSTAATTARPASGQRFLRSVEAALSQELRQRLIRLRWVDRLTSPWAPVVALALVFLAYTVVVELSVCSYLFLKPVAQVLGTACVAWWAAALVGPWVARGFFEGRRARQQAQELLDEVDVVASTRAAQVGNKVWLEASGQATAVLTAFPGEPAALREELKGLLATYEKHLEKLKVSSLLDAGGGVFKALAIALLVRVVLVEPYKIPSGSMIPTLEIGDQIFVNKLIYGVRLPFTNWVPFVAFRPPQRGDVIVFNNPVRPDLDYIKRVVAVGGDTLELKGRQIIVNGVAAPQEVVEPSFQHWEKLSTEGLTWGQWVQSWFVNDWFPRQAVLIRESIDGQPHWILHERGPSPSYEGVVQVPPGHVFVMGDNRDESQDSRLGLGGGYRGGDQPTLTNNGRVEFVPLGNIKGKAMVIWLSNAHGGPLSELFGGTGLRLDRFFEPIARCGGEPPPVQP